MELHITHFRRDNKYVHEFRENEVLCTYTQEHLYGTDATVATGNQTFTFSGNRSLLNITSPEGSYEARKKGIFSQQTSFIYKQKTYVLHSNGGMFRHTLIWKDETEKPILTIQLHNSFFLHWPIKMVIKGDEQFPEMLLLVMIASYFHNPGDGS